MIVLRVLTTEEIEEYARTTNRIRQKKLRRSFDYRAIVNCKKECGDTPKS